MTGVISGNGSCEKGYCENAEGSVDKGVNSGLIFKITHGYRHSYRILGWQFIVAMAMASLTIRGVTYGILNNGVNTYIDEFFPDSVGSLVQNAYIVGMVPYALKGVLGCISDTVTLFHSNKRCYWLPMAVLVTISCVVMWALKLTVTWFLIFTFIQNFALAWADLLHEATFSEKTNEFPDCGPNIISQYYLWGGIGSAIGTILTGVLADFHQNRLLFGLAGLSMSAFIPVLVKDLFKEKKKTPKFLFDMATVKLHKPHYFLSLLSAGGAIICVFAALWGSTTTNIVTSVSIIAVLCVAMFAVLPRTNAKAMSFLVIDSFTTFTITGAMYVFYTSDCFEGGPQFSHMFYFSIASTVTYLTSSLASVVFDVFLSKGTYRFSSFICISGRILASAIDIAIVKRWNKAIYISDSVAFLGGTSVLFQLMTNLSAMPQYIIMSRMCPPGLEAVMYAFMASASNVAVVAGGSVGSAMTTLFNLKLGEGTDTTCDFSNLPMLILCALVLPQFVSIACLFLMPPGKMEDPLEQEPESPHAVAFLEGMGADDRL